MDGSNNSGSGLYEYLLDNIDDGKTAVIDRGSHCSYGELQKMVENVGRLIAQASIPEFSRIALSGPNTVAWIAAYLAILRARCTVVPIPPVTREKTLESALRLADCAALIFDIASPAASFTNMSKSVIVDRHLGLGSAILNKAPVDGPDLQFPDAALMFTSGSTAEPKLVRATHQNIASNTHAISSCLELTAEDRALVVLPFSYCYGASVLHTLLRSGGSLTLSNSFTFTETAVELARESECTIIAGVPSTYQLLLRASSFGTRPLSTLRMMQQAGGRLAPELISKVRSAQPQADLFVMYGQTEATARLSYLHPRDLDAKLGSVGQGMPGVILTIRRDDGTVAAPGEQGEIYAAGPSISPGYWRDPVASEARFTPLGLRTGDLGTVDDDGFIFISGRSNDFIKSWGYRISSREVEDVVTDMEDVLVAFAVGYPNLERGEAVHLVVFVRPTSQITEQLLAARCADLLPRHMRPFRIHIADSRDVDIGQKITKSKLLDILKGGISN